MEWLSSIRKAIDFMEEHLTEDISAQDVAEEVFMSPFFLQKGFSLMTGYGISEYLRNRRLYQAALDLQKKEDKIIDIALRYGYETPESFSKAFARFHGKTPSQIREGAVPRRFLPLKINISIQGGKLMDVKIKTMFPFKVIGFEKRFDNETAYEKIPQFWDEIMNEYAEVYAGKRPVSEYEKAISDYSIGEYGVCIDDTGDDSFRYLIAGRYNDGQVPEGMTVHEFPRGDWAVFECVGPVPESLQSMNTAIFNEWLPGNPDYELCGNANIEWYDNGDMPASDYHSAIWIPVRKLKD